MQKGTVDNSNQSSSQNIESVQRVFYRLKELHEVEDQSRNELCPVFADEESRIRSLNQSQVSHSNPTNSHILKDLEDNEGMGIQSAPKSHFSQAKDFGLRSDGDDLRVANMKLKEDNVKLFAECIKLKKKCQAYEKQQFSNPFVKKQQKEDTSSKQKSLQVEIEGLRRQVKDLNTQKQYLSQKLTRQFQKDKELTLLSLRYKQKSTQNQQIAKINTQLATKLKQLEKQLELSHSRTISKSSSQNISINNTTQESRKSEVDKDRLITNLRIVHESEIRKLKGVIQELKKQYSKSEYGL